MTTVRQAPAAKRPPEVREHAGLFYRHTLAVNDVLIAAELLARRQPAVELAATRHDVELQRAPSS